MDRLSPRTPAGRPRRTAHPARDEETSPPGSRRRTDTCWPSKSSRSSGRTSTERSADEGREAPPSAIPRRSMRRPGSPPRTSSSARSRIDTGSRGAARRSDGRPPPPAGGRPGTPPGMRRKTAGAFLPHDAAASGEDPPGAPGREDREQKRRPGLSRDHAPAGATPQAAGRRRSSAERPGALPAPEEASERHPRPAPPRPEGRAGPAAPAPPRSRRSGGSGGSPPRPPGSGARAPPPDRSRAFPPLIRCSPGRREGRLRMRSFAMDASRSRGQPPDSFLTKASKWPENQQEVLRLGPRGDGEPQPSSFLSSWVSPPAPVGCHRRRLEKN